MDGTSTPRTKEYRKITSLHAEKLARFERQMADFARGQLLTQLREARHLSQEDAAYEIGTTAKSLRAWEHGGPIRWDNAKKVAEFYGVEPERLVSREISQNGQPHVIHPDEVVVGKLDEIIARLDGLEASLALAVPALSEPAPATKPRSRKTAKKRAAG